MVLFFLQLVLLRQVFGHGRLLTPNTRVGHQNYENDPTGSSGNGGNNNDAWVCRHAAANAGVSNAPIAAGSDLDLIWNFGAKHVGDCDVYISYDTTAARDQMKWFKIANLFDCRVDSDKGVVHKIKMPDMLKSGNAVLRWGWYALHQHPNVEFYSQCADIVITSARTQLDPNVKSYALIGANPVFPLRADQGVGYANRFPPIATWMTGPPCAYGIASDTNDCWRTAKGTQGYIDVGQSDSPAQPPSGTTSIETTQGSGTTGTPVSQSTTRCGCSWVDANSKCGKTCAVDSDCPSGDVTEKCYKDLQTCSALGVLNACTNWVKLDNRPKIPDDWCQLTCTAPETKQYCDSDACKCKEITVDGETFSKDTIDPLDPFGDRGSSPLLVTLFGLLITLAQF